MAKEKDSVQFYEFSAKTIIHPFIMKSRLIKRSKKFIFTFSSCSAPFDDGSPSS